MAKRQSKSSAPARPALLPVRIYRLHAKLAIAIVIGIAVALALHLVEMRAVARALIGWNVGVIVYLALTYAMMWRTEVEAIRRRAAEQDEGVYIIQVLAIAATFASLAAVLFALIGSKQSGVATGVPLAVTTILLSWTFVHTIFTFHYAHEYYGERRDGKIGGLMFPGDREPDYRDFLYFSLVIGMTSQVSDVQVTSKVIRRLVAIHGVLSFFFNLVVLALTVNMIAALL
ncbi:MAG: DUF1345 domain-containing protein [Pseudolabrys sp.]|nr:DUF1345 domain-containing protein [Pseudolabrys sp.]